MTNCHFQTNFVGEGKNKIGTYILHKLTWKVEGESLELKCIKVFVL